VKTRILLADDHELMRVGLRTVLEREAGIEVVAEAADGRAAVELAKQLKPDIVVIDISMPELSGIEATRQIVHQLPRSKVIVLSLHNERHLIEQMFAAGASAYLLKNSAAVELSLAVHAVLHGETYLSPEVAQMVLGDFMRRSHEAHQTTFVNLTPREREVLQLVAEGKSNKEIALRLDISAKTVDTHRQQLMEKLGIRSVAELTKYAIREGLTSLDT